ncbi:hypothetical protein [Sulfuricurvum sp.]|uniref:hypothetical protein n=1 Tax=Sulfuricurvum sp. TaxID=2025608 RepID=UPI00260ACAB6|nr:hypothetical protein [Sulfuricurvum sp.]MDD2267681.1 hypothetical protein [Sulfuricurvum sp.]MDD2784118.1 hypothetical protein [Sulfuricurvum sp.]
MVVNKEEEIKQINIGAPHLVILGAGASYASFRLGDKNNKQLPLMNNLIDILELDDLIKQTQIEFQTSNFEEIYDQISKDPTLYEIKVELEQKVYEYFSSLEILETPTIYDYLLLSLREKDFIATFNWDPFLIQAYRRNGNKFKLPKLIFLHGNVEVGYCPNGHIKGNIGQPCSICHEALIPSKLLYPIGDKNYSLDPFIHKEWEIFKDVLKHSFMVTIFGYGAPKSDKGAIDLMEKAWNHRQRALEETEIIDIRAEDDLIETWQPFIFSHHYKIENDFFSSWIANHPRRTGEAYWNQFIDAKFIEDNPIPQNVNFEELWSWYEELAKYE